jgi:DNA-binding HxlR family transcriptional regulator
MVGDAWSVLIFEKHRYSEHPPRDEYRLTECGLGFVAVLSAMKEWGSRYNGDGIASSMSLDSAPSPVPVSYTDPT